MSKVTESKLLELGFECIRNRNEDLDGLWFKDGVTLHQDFWEGKNFYFPTKLDDKGELKSGTLVDNVDRLNELIRLLN